MFADTVIRNYPTYSKRKTVFLTEERRFKVNPEKIRAINDLPEGVFWNKKRTLKGGSKKMKKRSLKIMSVVLAGVMTTGMILGGCSAGGDKENGGNKEASKELNLWMHNGQAFVDETKKLAENYEKGNGSKD